MRYAWLLVIAATLPACRGAHLVSGSPPAGKSSKPLQHADPSGERPNVFARYLERGEAAETPGRFDLDMDAVTRRVLEDQERSNLGRSQGRWGISIGWGPCR